MRVRTGNRIIRFIPVLAIGAGSLVALAPGASATGTAATFVLGGGSLSITQPASASLGTVTPGTLTLSHQLGTVTVSDSRGLLTDSWTASVISTNFVTGGSTTYETVTAANIAYSAGTATSTSGIGTFTPGTLATMAVSGVAGTWAGTSSNTVSWDPTITFTLSPSQSAGTYSGTITHSVA
jgi:hypothetical protein